jgi:hypothetical protein
VTNDEDAVPTLGRRLDAVARARVRALAPRPAWVAPLAVALHRSEEVADVLGERFERTERQPRGTGELPADLADLLAGSGTRAAPGAWAAGERPAQAVPQRPAAGGDERLPPPEAEAWPAEAAPGGDEPDGELRALPADVRSRLHQEVGPAADLMRVHTGPRADTLARAADADAVTVGQDIHLRQGRWAPRREEGVALLAHEATHVAALLDRGTAAWRRAVGEDAEEALARARERSLLGHDPGLPRTVPGGGAGLPTVLEALAAPRRSAPEPAAPGFLPVPAPLAAAPHHTLAAGPAAPAGALPGATVAAPARRAGVERDLAPAASVPDLEALRRGVIAEVMQRLRSEIERGA